MKGNVSYFVIQGVNTGLYYNYSIEISYATENHGNPAAVLVAVLRQHDKDRGPVLSARDPCS